MIHLRDYQRDLIDDTRHAFKSGHQRPLVVLPCGAGKTVCFADMAERHTRKAHTYVWFLVHRRELIDQTLATFDMMGIKREHIYVGMVGTALRHPTPPTLIIFDEAHHATARTWQRVTEAYPDVPVVGLTATPSRRDGRALGDIFDSLIVGAEAEWLQEHGYLAPYDYYAPRTVDIRTVKMYGVDYDGEAVTDVLIESRIYGDVMKYIDTTRKTIIYAPSIRYSRMLAEQIPYAVHFDGTTSKAERDRIIREFRDGTIRVLINVDLVGEGFDVPDCDTIMLLRPTTSVALYIQQSMRAMRPREGKRAVVYDFVGNVFRHGMPTDKRDWSLTGRIKARNAEGEPDVLVRQCEACYRVYGGIGRVCPYCGHDNGKTRAEIKRDEEAQLELVRKVERRQQGRAQTYEELVKIGYERGYKNPQYWARMVVASRGKKGDNI